ncbi:MAG: hypothetical protein OXE96_10295 [Gemmatimonadetes bacterium]|nr:hypothetical protein [Gemmatimonadota bacterium]
MTRHHPRARVFAVHLPALVPWLLLCACAPSDDGPAAFAQRDSAGIAIIESVRPAWGDSAHWQVHPEPVVDLAESGTAAAHDFYRVLDVRRFSDGSLVVANRGSNEIRKFSADGSFIGSAGGYGEGPGEFANMQQIDPAGDSLLVLDWDGRMTLFGPDLTLVRTLWPNDDVSEMHYLGDGLMVTEVVVPDIEGVGLVRHRGVLVVFDLEGEGGDSIGWTFGHEEYVTDILSSRPLFGKNSLLDTHGDRIFLGSSDHMQVEEINARGDTLRVLRIPDFPLSLSAEQVEAERNARFDIPLPQGVTSLPPPFVAAIEGMPSPERRPAYANMLVDPMGAVWLLPHRGFSEEGGPEDWQVLGPNGNWLGSVEIPEGFRVTELGTDEVLGVWTDELDVQHPQVLRLSR